MTLLLDSRVVEFEDVVYGLDHGIGHLACMSPQNNERLTFSKG